MGAALGQGAPGSRNVRRGRPGERNTRVMRAFGGVLGPAAGRAAGHDEIAGVPPFCSGIVLIQERLPGANPTRG